MTDKAQFTIEPVALSDIRLISNVMALGEGYELTEEFTAGLKDISAKIADYVRPGRKFGQVVRARGESSAVAFLLAEIRNRHSDVFEAHSIIDELDAGLFPDSGEFCEIFDLWVDPRYRRKGLASKLKQKLEADLRVRGCSSIYTHTELSNTHVLQFYAKLGYHPVRSGPIWDEIPRVSLMKKLTLMD